MATKQQAVVDRASNIAMALGMLRGASDLIVEAMRATPRGLKILIVVEGGTVQSVYAMGEGEADVVIHDYDNAEAEDATHEEFDRQHWFSDGQTVAKFFKQVQLGNPEYREIA